jgi:hypothetical protein
VARLALDLLHVLATADQGAAPGRGDHYLIPTNVAAILLSDLLYRHLSLDSFVGVHIITTHVDVIGKPRAR